MNRDWSSTVKREEKDVYFSSGKRFPPISRICFQDHPAGRNVLESLASYPWDGEGNLGLTTTYNFVSGLMPQYHGYSRRRGLKRSAIVAITDNFTNSVFYQVWYLKWVELIQRWTVK